MTPLVLLLAAGAWQRISLPQVKVAVDMPATPEYSQKLDTSGALFALYESDTAQGAFKTGMAVFTGEQRKQLQEMREHGSRQELEYLVEGTLSNAVTAFAKVENMQVSSHTFLLGNGLPAEFATITGTETQLKIHAYFTLKGLILVSAPVSSPMSAHFWASLKLPKE